ncbi:major facilitator superfamily-domain-containing protein [Absidia repens]|uniref:Major facilitator superfamily-domain-containing protein n=1 Tax=Absidia repens TaxID=90262 RepID=A0A1X2J1F7_9FUNG|nr:major facilitator superfamily-domain-containing protein [Absidia repens]
MENTAEKTTLDGVQKVRLFTKVWTKRDKVVIFCGLLLLSWAVNWEGTLGLTTNVNAMIELNSNNIISILSTVAFIIQCVCFPFYSKISDMTGRANAYTAAMVLYVIATIIMASAPTYGSFVGGQVVYSFGYSGILILGPIVIGDLTNVVDRGLMQALYNVPSLINLFVTPLVGDALGVAKWRWGYGMNSILLTVCSVPLLASLWHLQYRVKKSEHYIEYKRQQKAVNNMVKKKTLMEKIAWFIAEVDLIGSLLLVGGLCMILLPLVLSTTMWGGWQSSRTIGCLVAGVVAWVIFGIYEWKFATKPVLPIMKWQNRTPLLGILVLSIVTLISSTNWMYFPTYLMISRKVTSGEATLLDSGYRVGYTIGMVMSGTLMKLFKKWRPMVWMGISLMILGIGLMIPARLPHSSNAFIVISQTIAGFGSGTLDIPIMVAIQSSVGHEDLALVTGLIQVGGSIAGSVGSTLSGAVWNGMLPGLIKDKVPGDYDYAKIVSNIPYAVSLPEDQYNAVVDAFGETQRVLSIIAVSLAGLAFIFTLPMRSFGLEDRQDEQTGDDKADHVDEDLTQYGSRSDEMNSEKVELPEAMNDQHVDSKA